MCSERDGLAEKPDDVALRRHLRHSIIPDRGLGESTQTHQRNHERDAQRFPHISSLLE
jgi:hypothetical protein